MSKNPSDFLSNALTLGGTAALKKSFGLFTYLSGLGYVIGGLFGSDGVFQKDDSYDPYEEDKKKRHKQSYGNTQSRAVSLGDRLPQHFGIRRMRLDHMIPPHFTIVYNTTKYVEELYYIQYFILGEGHYDILNVTIKENESVYNYNDPTRSIFSFLHLEPRGTYSLVLSDAIQIPSKTLTNYELVPANPTDGMIWSTYEFMNEGEMDIEYINILMHYPNGLMDAGGSARISYRAEIGEAIFDSNGNQTINTSTIIYHNFSQSGATAVTLFKNEAIAIPSSLRNKKLAIRVRRDSQQLTASSSYDKSVILSINAQLSNSYERGNHPKASILIVRSLMDGTYSSSELSSLLIKFRRRTWLHSSLSGWSTTQYHVNQNPVTAVMHILKEKGLPDSQIDMDAFDHQRIQCDLRGDKTGITFSNDVSYDDAISSILKGIRCKHIYKHGIMTIIRDEPQTNPRCVIRDCHVIDDDISIKVRLFQPNEQKGVRLSYIQENTFLEKQATYGSAPFKTISDAGIIQDTQAANHARYLYKDHLLRRTTITARLGAIGGVLNAGDTVLLQTSLLNTSSKSAMILDVAQEPLVTNGYKLTIDRSFTFINQELSVFQPWAQIEDQISLAPTPTLSIAMNDRNGNPISKNDHVVITGYSSHSIIADTSRNSQQITLNHSSDSSKNIVLLFGGSYKYPIITFFKRDNIEYKAIVTDINPQEGKQEYIVTFLLQNDDVFV